MSSRQRLFFRVLLAMGLVNTISILALKSEPELLVRLCSHGCSRTLLGDWSLLGLDLAWWGLGFFVLLTVTEKSRILIPAGLALSVVLTLLQIFHLRALCAPCLFSAGVILALSLVGRVRRPAWLLLLPPLLALPSFWAPPARRPPEQLKLPPEARRCLMTWQAGESSRDEICLVFDYACGHCRAVAQLEVWQAAYPGTGIKLLYMPVFPGPREKVAARIALAAEAFGHFPEVHRELCALLDRGETPVPERLLSEQELICYRQETPVELRALQQSQRILGLETVPLIYRNGLLAPNGLETDRPMELVTEARRRLLQGDSARALSASQAALAACYRSGGSPESVRQARELLAQSLSLAGRREEALGQFRVLLAEFPERVDYRLEVERLEQLGGKVSPSNE